MVKKMKKIMIDASITSKGGGVQVSLALIENIVKDSDFEVIFIANTEIDKQLPIEVKSKIKYYYVEKIEPIYKKFFQGKRIALIEQKHKPDLVFIVFGPAYRKPRMPSLQGFALGKMLYKSELNLSFIENLLNAFKMYIFKSSKSDLVVETQLVKEKLVSQYNFSREKIFVIGNSYSPKFHECIEKNKRVMKPSSEAFTILVPGSYYSHKNLERVIASINLIKENSEIDNFEFLFTIPVDSIEWQNLYNYAKDLGVSSYIRTSGFVENASFGELYLKSHAVLCASLVESSTAVFPEAFISERPLLVSSRPFAIELCENGALYFDPLDEKSIANAIIKIISDQHLREGLVTNANLVLVKNYPTAEEKWASQKKLILNLSGKNSGKNV